MFLTSILASKVTKKTSRHPVVITDEEDDEPTSRGGTLDPDSDIIMEEVINIPSDAENKDEQASEEDPEEDGEEGAAEKELSTLFLCVLSCIYTYSFNGCRDPSEEVDCAHICLFQGGPHHRVRKWQTVPHIYLWSYAL